MFACATNTNLNEVDENLFRAMNDSVIDSITIVCPVMIFGQFSRVFKACMNRSRAV